MNWEPWTGCYGASEGCMNCYFYGPHAKRFGQNTITRTRDFYKPLESTQKGPRLPGGRTIPTCFATDFFIPEADHWRSETWDIIRKRPDLIFLILTKRIDRVPMTLPEDWGDGYDNVYLGCTVESQQRADQRLPIFLSLPLKHRFIACSPLLEPIDLRSYLDSTKINQVTVSGEQGRGARACHYDWLLYLKQQTEAAGIKFWLKSPGSNSIPTGQTSLGL